MAEKNFSLFFQPYDFSSWTADEQKGIKMWGHYMLKVLFIYLRLKMKTQVEPLVERLSPQRGII